MCAMARMGPKSYGTYMCSLEYYGFDGTISQITAFQIQPKPHFYAFVEKQ